MRFSIGDFRLSIPTRRVSEGIERASLALRVSVRNIENRRAFTLVEMLLVMSIIVILVVMMVPMTMRMQERDQVAKGATVVQGALLQAKVLALRDKQNTGVRLLLKINRGEVPDDGLDNDGNKFPDDRITVEQIEYIQEPTPFSDGWVWAEMNFGGGVSRVTLPNFDADTTPPKDQASEWVIPNLMGTEMATEQGFWLYGPYSTTWERAGGGPVIGAQRETFTFDGSVQIGDLVELHGGGQVYSVVAVRSPAPEGSNPRLPAGIKLNRSLLGAVHVPTNFQPNYRIIRRPRPLSAEKPVRLPANVTINLSAPDLVPVPPSTTQYRRDPTDQYYVKGLSVAPHEGTLSIEILFSPSGRVVGQAAVADVIYLWLTDTSPGNMDNQGLVAVYTRTGTVATYAVNNETGGDPYKFAKQGRGAGGL